MSIDTLGHENGRFILEHSVLFSKIVSTYKTSLEAFSKQRALKRALSHRVGSEVCDDGHRLGVMEKSNCQFPVAVPSISPKLHVAESRVSKSARHSGTPGQIGQEKVLI